MGIHRDGWRSSVADEVADRLAVALIRLAERERRRLEAAPEVAWS